MLLLLLVVVSSDRKTDRLCTCTVLYSLYPGWCVQSVDQLCTVWTPFWAPHGWLVTDPQVVTDVLVTQLKEVLGKDAPMAVTPGVVHEKDSRGFWTTSITSGKGKITSEKRFRGQYPPPVPVAHDEKT